MSRLNPNEKCVWCGKESVIQIGIPMGKLSESNKIIYTEDNAYQSVQVTFPFCAYHAPFTEAGLVVYIQNDNTPDGFIFPSQELIDRIEAMNNEEINKEIKNIKKDKNYKKDQSKRLVVEIAYSVLSGRNGLEFLELQKKYPKEVMTNAILEGKMNIKKIKKYLENYEENK